MQVLKTRIRPAALLSFLSFVIFLLPACAAPTVTLVLGQPTDRSITLAARADTALEWYFEYGARSGAYSARSATVTGAADPNAAGFYLASTTLRALQPDTQYFFRMQARAAGSDATFTPGTEGRFHTQRPPGSTFTFAVQGDSHPEREKQMFSSVLYNQTMAAVAADHPDFYITSGDDFSVDTLPTPYTRPAVTGRYTIQLPYFTRLATPLFLGTGNHEETSLSNYNLPADATNGNQVPIWAQNARNLYYPSPGPDDAETGTFYSGNATKMAGIGLLRDYYAWEWGDALFVVIDPYWSSPAQVDTGLGGQNSTGGKTSDKWAVTHGDAQYQWLKRTLEQSKARWKFIFAHHVMGSGRGGVEIAGDFEWGGKSANGNYAFPANRPTWQDPIHQLMVANKVTIFFQAHDHLFARQVLDGVVYQSLPNPADNTYTAFNADAYKTGDVLPNAGYTRVTVGPTAVKVDYIREFLPADEKPPTQVSGATAFTYMLQAPGGSQPVISGMNTAGGGATIAPNTWVELRGSNLAPAGLERVWRAADFVNDRLPTQLEGVSVTVNGKPAYIYYASPSQINLLTPPDALGATAAVQVTVGNTQGPSFAVPAAALAPALFTFSGTPHTAATHADGTLLGPTSLYPGFSTPARPGEVIVIYGNGFGPTTQPIATGSVVQAGSLPSLPQVTLGGLPVQVQFAGLVAPGEFQFNVVVPASLADGDWPLKFSYSGASTQDGPVISVRK